MILREISPSESFCEYLPNPTAIKEKEYESN